MSRRVVVTGAAGTLGTQLLPALEERYQCVLLDITAERVDGVSVADLHVVDLADRRIERYRDHFCGADTVVHLAHAKAPSMDSAKEPESYFNERYNVDMTRNVLETARQEGVRRVVSFSSIHAADFHEQLVWRKSIDSIGPEANVRSDNFYGWGKQSSEMLGFVYASGNVGRAVEVVMLRIGRRREVGLAACGGDAYFMNRELAMYLSVRDMQLLVVRSIEAQDIRDEHGIPFRIFFGVSDNSRGFLSLENARSVIGYEPQDDSEVKFADQIAVNRPPA